MNTPPSFDSESETAHPRWIISRHSSRVIHLTEQEESVAIKRYWDRILKQPRSGNNPRVAAYLREPVAYND